MTIQGLRTQSDQKLTQFDIACEAEISLRYYISLEKGKKNPTLKVIDRIAHAFGMPAWQLMQLVENIG